MLSWAIHSVMFTITVHVRADVLVCVYVNRYTLQLWVYPECIGWGNCLAELFIVCNLNFPAQPSNANTHTHKHTGSNTVTDCPLRRVWKVGYYCSTEEKKILTQWMVNMSDSPKWADSAYFFQKLSGFKPCKLFVSCFAFCLCKTGWENEGFDFPPVVIIFKFI